MSETLIEIRCPETVTSKKTGFKYPCNRLCVKVAPGSTGEAWCPSCRITFTFDVDDQRKEAHSRGAIKQDAF